MLSITLEEWERRLAANPDYAVVERRMRPYLNIAHAILTARVEARLMQVELGRRAGLRAQVAALAEERDALTARVAELEAAAERQQAGVA